MLAVNIYDSCLFKTLAAALCSRKAVSSKSHNLVADLLVENILFVSLGNRAIIKSQVVDCRDPNAYVDVDNFVYALWIVSETYLFRKGHGFRHLSKTYLTV